MPHGRSFATVKFKVGGSGCFLYLAGADARGANADLFPHARHDRAHALQVRIPPAPPRVIRVADHVSKMRRFAAKLTLQCHFSSCFNFYLGLDFLLELSQNQAPHSSRPSTSGKARLCTPAISQFHSLRVDNCLIPQALALCDQVGGFCRRKKTSERAAAGLPAGKIEGRTGRPHRGAQRISIVAGFNWNPAGG